MNSDRRKKFRSSKGFYLLLLAISLVTLSALALKIQELRKHTSAVGVYSQINSGVGQAGGYDAISWSPANPLLIDSYGKFISIAQHYTDGFFFIFNNSEGEGEWEEIGALSGSIFRPTVVYDDKSDKLHMIQSGANEEVTYKRYRIVRDSRYNIKDIVLDSSMTTLALDDIGTCSAYQSNHPLAFLKDNGSTYTLVAFWSLTKTCGANTYTETRAAMRELSNTSADGVGANWEALDGTDDGSGGAEDANVSFTKLYSYNNAYANAVFQHSVLLKTAGAHSNDIYYFNTDQNDTNGYTRLAWNSGSGNWSSGVTSRQTFGGNVGNLNGYSLKQELLTKPVYSQAGDRVYVGIARWLNGTDGDTQSLFYVEDDDSITLAGNLYSAGETGTPGHCLYPTLDISADSYNGDVYAFYDISGTSDCGHVEYVVYNGTNFSSPQTYYSVPDNSIDIPITYHDRYKNKILLLYRRNNEVDPANPPHYIDFGYISLSQQIPPQSISITSPHTISTYDQFTQYCGATYEEIVPSNVEDGELMIEGSFRDDFEDPLPPYTGMFYGWGTGTYSGGSYTPVPSGTINVQNSSSGGAYQYTTGTGYQFTRTRLSFRAQFSSNAPFQHIGFASDESFGQFIMFSTSSSNSNLYARYHDGSVTESIDLGTGYLDDYHDFEIEWLADKVVYYIDQVEVHSTENTVGIFTTYGSPLSIMLSNNSDGTDLLVDHVGIVDVVDSDGEFTSCIYDSGSAGSYWIFNFNSTDPSGTTVEISARTSEDKINWSSWTDVTDGTVVSGISGRYVQYNALLTTSDNHTPLFELITLNIANRPDDPTNLAPTQYVSGGYTNDTSPTFTFDLTDPDEGDQLGYIITIATDPDFNNDIIYYSDSGFPQGTNSFTVGQAAGMNGTYVIGQEDQTLDEGSYYWRVQAYDSALESEWVVANEGNVSFNIDFTLPEIISVTSSTPDGLYGIGDQISLNVTFSEPVISTGNFVLNLNSAGACTSSVLEQTVATCVYTVEVGEFAQELSNSSLTGVIKDRATNQLTDFTSVTNLVDGSNITVDGIAPTAFTPTISEGSPTTDNTPTLLFATTDNLAVERYEVSVDGGEFAVKTSPHTLAELVSGSHSVTVRAYDSAGNHTDGVLQFEISEDSESDSGQQVSSVGNSTDESESESSIDSEEDGEEVRELDGMDDSSNTGGTSSGEGEKDDDESSEEDSSSLGRVLTVGVVAIIGGTVLLIGAKKLKKGK